MPKTVEQALSEAAFYGDDTEYVLVKLPPTAIIVAASIIAEVGQAFGALVVDKDEVTLLTDSRVTTTFAKRLIDSKASPSKYRLITVDVELEPEITGFIARLSNALAEAGVSLLPYAAFTRDHLLVLSAQFEQALSALEKLKASIK